MSCVIFYGSSGSREEPGIIFTFVPNMFAFICLSFAEREMIMEFIFTWSFPYGVYLHTSGCPMSTSIRQNRTFSQYG